jgi:glucose/arabinose dehydrogenase
MVAGHGRVYVTHRDEEGRGVITRFDYEGNYKPLVGELPARADHSVTDIALARDGRLFFGVGSATNSGVVGLDNIEWLRRNRPVCDEAWTDPASAALYLNGWRFDSTNPFAGLFGGSDVSVTAPFQPFGRSLETRIPRCATGMPNAAVFSINPEGGDLRVEAFGVRNPVGLGFNDVGRLFLTNQGMKLRGTRPVKDDPDVLLRMVSGQWYGWPDFSANLLPIQEARFQPPREMIVKSGYGELSFLIDHQRSNLRPPTRRQENLLAAEFPALAGAAKFDFIPSSGPLARLGEGRDVAIVALSGDRAPFDTGGLDLIAPMGYKLVAVRLGPGLGRVEEFIRNTRQGPSSKHRDRPGDAVELERPIDVKFGPDGAMYILDFGRMEMYGPRQRVTPGSGRVLKLTGIAEPTTRP